MLRVESLTAGYGGVPVVHDVSLEVAAGEVVTLIGANGAGKSTLLKAVAGLLKPNVGRVLLEGEDVTGRAPHKLVSRGVAFVPEGRALFPDMTVEENLRLGAFGRGREGRRAWAAEAERVYGLFGVLGERRTQPAGTLSGGEQQMLAIGRALMAKPRLVLLDEPSLGLAPKVIAEIFSSLDALRAEGLTILLVEQDAALALRHADRGYVMRTGTVAMSGTAAELAADDDVRLIYLGAWHGENGD